MGGTAVDRLMQVRGSAPKSKFYDMHYQDLIADSVGMVRRIYEYFSYDFNPGMGERMRRWLSANPQHKYGQHRYSMNQFGLNQWMIDLRFAAYREKFNIKPE
ncbi:MAG: sulfotransferase [bacterium]